MARLYRPHIPLSVRVQVAERQCDVTFREEAKATLRQRLDALLPLIAAKFGCEKKDLRLDHDPPLGARQQFKNGRGEVIRYVPDANDPEHLAYRPHGTQFDGSHDVKTRIRGDRGQYSDLTLIKRQRRRERPLKPKKKWQSKPFSKIKRKLPSRGFRK